MKSLPILFLVLLLAGCADWPTKPFQHVPDPGPVVALSPRELDVIVALLTAEYPGTVQKGHPLVIDETPSISMVFLQKPRHGREAELLAHNPDHVPRDAIRNFLAANSTEARIGPELGSRLNVILFSRADGEQVFTGKDEWRHFYRVFPDSPGCITVSRVGFSADGRTALVYLGGQRASLAGGGGVHVLRLVGGRWTVTPSVLGMGWVS